VPERFERRYVLVAPVLRLVESFTHRNKRESEFLASSVSVIRVPHHTTFDLSHSTFEGSLVSQFPLEFHT
jgi:hypothetical protein